MNLSDAIVAIVATCLSVFIAISVIAFFWYLIYKKIFSSFQFIREFVEPDEGEPEAATLVSDSHSESSGRVLRTRVRRT